MYCSLLIGQAGAKTGLVAPELLQSPGGVPQNQKGQFPKPGELIARELAQGQIHNYQISLSSGQYLRLIIDHQGMGVGFTLQAPDGGRVFEVKRQKIINGKLSVSIIAEASGTYLMEVKPWDYQAPSGRYEFIIAELREAAGLDRTRIEAETAYRKGNELRLLFSPQTTPQAISYFEKAIKLFQTLGDAREQAYSLLGMGILYRYLGENQRALDYLNQALPLMRSAGEPKGLASVLSNTGFIYQSMGDNQKALQYSLQSLPAARESKDKNEEAMTLSTIGIIYADWGETEKALEYWSDTLQLAQSDRDRRTEAYTFILMGKAHNAAGNYQEALDLCRRGLAIMQSLKDPSGQTLALSQMGTAYVSLGQKEQALECFNQTLTILNKFEDYNRLRQTLIAAGMVYQSLGEIERGREFLNRALPLSLSAGDRRGQATVLYGLARIERGQGDLKQANAFIRNALELVEDLRTRINEQDHRASFLATVQDFYSFYADLLMQMHREQPSEGLDRVAFEVSERSRARSLLDLLAEARADIRQGVDPRLLEREHELRQRLMTQAERKIRLGSADSSALLRKGIDKEIGEATIEYQRVRSEIRATSPRYAALMQPQPLTAAAIQEQLLDQDTLLLEYSLGESRSFLWALTPTSISSYELPAGKVIEKAARRVYASLTARQRLQRETEEQYQARVAKADSDYHEAALVLSRMVLGPVANMLGDKRLLIVADGALQYVPFAALPEPTSRASSTEEQSQSVVDPQPLILKHEIVNLPSASVLSLLRESREVRPAAQKTVAVLADPVFDGTDPRVKTFRRSRSTTPDTSDLAASRAGRALRSVTDSRDGLVRLAFTREEAEAIVSAAPPGSAKKALGFKANRMTALGSELATYKIVHFATHGILNAENPSLSGVVLSLVDEKGNAQQGFLGLTDIYNMNLPVDLVVLSACQTGLGREVRGEGMIGLVRGFMYAGARRVVASLWNVDDGATAELMKRMYHAILKNGVRPAAALRQAQTEMLQKAQWKNPYHWAGFVIQGEWK